MEPIIFKTFRIRSYSFPKKRICETIMAELASRLYHTNRIQSCNQKRRHSASLGSLHRGTDTLARSYKVPDTNFDKSSVSSVCLKSLICASVIRSSITDGIIVLLNLIPHRSSLTLFRRSAFFQASKNCLLFSNRTISTRISHSSLFPTFFQSLWNGGEMTDQRHM